MRTPRPGCAAGSRSGCSRCAPGVYIGNYSRRTRERIWNQVLGAIGEGNAVIAWAAPNDAGFEFDTCGQNRRVPVDLDGSRLVSFLPPAA